MATDNTNTGPITLVDVRAALGETDPATTNASALRAIIGRGSFATIQKHLDTIRQERAPAPAPAPGTAPAAPAEAVAAMWGAAYAAAQVLTLGRLEIVTMEREQLTGTVAQLGQDLAAALIQVDAVTTALDASLVERDQLAGDIAVERDQFASELAAAGVREAKALEDHKQSLDASRHALELLNFEFDGFVKSSKKDAANAALTMQATIDKLTDQIGELKSLLHTVKK